MNADREVSLALHKQSDLIRLIRDRLQMYKVR